MEANGDRNDGKDGNTEGRVIGNGKGYKVDKLRKPGG